VHPCPWLTVNVCPAMVSVPDRAGPVVAATVNCTSPLPLPFVLPLIVIQDSPLFAVQVHPSPAVTVTLPPPPPESMDWFCGEME